MTYAICLPIVRSQVEDLYEKLDLLDPNWRFYNTYDDAAMDETRHNAVREANMRFIKHAKADGRPMDALAVTHVCVDANTAMLLRLSYTDAILKELEDRS